MESHSYQISTRECLRLVVPTVVVIACLLLGLGLGRRLDWLPAPSPAWDPELVVLSHQSRALEDSKPASILLAGDSTCLAGVDALELSKELPGRPRVRNLALFIWLSLETYGELVSDYESAHPGHVRAVVMLITPLKLAPGNNTPAADSIWREVRSKRGATETSGGASARIDWLGTQWLHRYLLGTCLATPLRGTGAGHFGFTSRIEDYMEAHCGSVPTFGTAKVPARRLHDTAEAAPLVLAPDLEETSRSWRKHLAPGVRLFVGLTPGMAGTSGPNEQSRREALLRQWNTWLDADVILTNLPATLPDVFFSPGAHLNQAGQMVYTRLLAKELTPLLEGTLATNRLNL